MSLLAGGVATVVAVLAVGSAGAAATPSLHQMYVNPIMTPAPASGLTSGAHGNYGLRSCQTQQNVGACYDPYQMRHAYGVDSLIANGYDGTGKTIVILDAFDDTYLQSDFDTFNSTYGLPNQTITQVYPGGQANTPYDAGWSQEMQLDVDWSHAIAPGATIVLVHGMSNSDQDLVAALNYAINNNLGDVISMSFGESDQCLGSALTAQWHQAFVNATKKNITLFASSGDQGASQPSCDGNSWIQSTSSPASDPLVTAVGGTELNASGWDPCATPRDTTTCTPTGGLTPGTWLSEIGWNEGPTGDFSSFFGATEASGGGYSTIWRQPDWQTPLVQSKTAPKPPERAVPDVSYNGAILHGVLVPLTEFGGVFRFGGTSCGSPQWAALAAIADQKAGHDYGFLNKALYQLGMHNDPHHSDYGSALYDVTSGNNNAVEFDSNSNEVDIPGFNAGTGWDAVTGLGSPKTGGLVTQLAKYWKKEQAHEAIDQSKVFH